jgi:hypothetical protein
MAVDKSLGFESATILDASGVYVRKWDEAIKQVAAGLSKEESASSPAYAIVVYHKKHTEGRPNYLAAAKTFARAYKLGLGAISRIEHEILTSPQEGHLKTLEPEDHVRVFLGTASSKDIKRQMQRSPGIYIIPSHLDASFLANLDLPAFPALLSNIPLVIQVEDSGLMVEEEESIWGGLRNAIRKPSVAVDSETASEKDTLAWRKRFMSEYPGWTSAQIAEESTSLAKNQPATASRWAKEKKIFAIEFQGQKWFPRFQFKDGRPIPAVSQVIRVFPEHATGWELAYFLTAPNAYIAGRKPFELLKEDPSRVVSLAQGFVHPADVF